MPGYSLAPTNGGDELADESNSDGGLTTMSPTRRKKMAIETSDSRPSYKKKTSRELEMTPLSPGSDGVFERFDDEIGEDGLHVAQMRSTVLPLWFEDWLFPPHLPRQCQLLRVENIAVPACYLLVGLLLGLSSPLINAYPIDLGASEAQQTSISAIRNLPASFKLIFGFLSDSTPLMGYRRKSYMLRKSQLDATPSVPPDDAPTMPFLSLCALMAGMGLWLADVMGDSIVAEKAKLEPPEYRGSIQSSCYAFRFFGSMIAVPLGTYLYSTLGPFYVVVLLALLPLSIIPFVVTFNEIKDLPVAPIPEQCQEIFNTVCSRAVWQPLGFVWTYNILQVGNSAWKQFLRTNLGFTACQLNMMLVSAYILLYAGVLTYKYYMINWSWRKVYIVTTLLNGLFSILQVLLIYGITFGLSPFLFAFGDDAFADFLGGVQFLPTTIMMVHLCPSGSEGASYSMFTTVNNSAGTLSVAVSTMLLGIWDVSKKALENEELQGLVNLTYLTTALQVSGVFLVFLLPQYKEDLERLKASKTGTSKIGGVIFLTITFSSIAYAIAVGLLNIIAPGWMGES
ncbi:biopterin transporter 1, chloroplastic [Seminavis robusta]|uniref:Biopterin transporter 1, chloroplastic n=1 Tax=Seminavis robusta TaxID=568900 RepID=A0A9N8DD44_9STRA|nr:biopterin transporter 1, chloroplastic [Seminavis robusta]|eukprot:Sro84_g044770.1 biopterin transporter 1, chloroplastic (567) ;mRNA; r:47587-49781